MLNQALDRLLKNAENVNLGSSIYFALQIGPKCGSASTGLYPIQHADDQITHRVG